MHTRVQAQAGTFDGPHTGPLASRAVVSRGDQSLGFAGVEAIGQTNAVVNFAGAELARVLKGV